MADKVYVCSRCGDEHSTRLGAQDCCFWKRLTDMSSERPPRRATEEELEAIRRNQQKRRQEVLEKKYGSSWRKVGKEENDLIW